MKRKLLSILLALSMALTLLPMTALAEEAAGSESGNVAAVWGEDLETAPDGYAVDGTNKKVTISSADGLAWFARQINSVKTNEKNNTSAGFRGYTFELDTDISLAGKLWTPIDPETVNPAGKADRSETFKNGLLEGATIDGKHHTISGMTIHTAIRGPMAGHESEHGDGQSCYYYSAFVGRSTGTLTIKNLTFDGATVDAHNEASINNQGSSSLAIVLGMNSGSLTCENVYVKNSAVSGYTKLGAFTGNDSGTLSLTNCSVEGCRFNLEPFTANGSLAAPFFAAAITGFKSGSNPILTNVRLKDNTFNLAEQFKQNSVIGANGTPIYYGDDGDWTLIYADAVYRAGYTGRSLTIGGTEHREYGVSYSLVAEVNGRDYFSLAAAYAALPRNVGTAGEPTVITLLADSSGGGIGADTDKGMNYVIDFNGFTYTVGAPAVGSTGTVSQGLRVMKGSKAEFKNGTLKAADYDKLVQVVHTYGDVTFDNFTVDAREDSYAVRAVEPDCGTLTLSGNSSILAREGKTGLYMAFWHTSNYDGTTVNIDTTGKITGKLVYEFDEDCTGENAATENKAVLNIYSGTFEIPEIALMYSGVAEELQVAKIYISGGTFTVDPSAHLVEDACMKPEGAKYIVAASHTVVTDAAVNATCTVDGKTEGSHCSVCGKIFTPQETISATGHSYSDTWSKDETKHWHECVNGDSKQDEADHTWNDGVVTTQPTTSATGVRTYTCEVCGATKTENIDKLPSGNNSSSSSGSTTTKTETTTNPDGSTTKTETKSDGTTVETTTNPDGSTTKTETKKDGSSVTESKDASGSTGTVKTDKDGKTEAEAKISEKAVEDAKKNDAPVTAPVEVKAGENSNSAPTVKIELPENAGETKVEIPVSNVNSGTVAVIVNEDGTEEIVKNSIVTENGVILNVEGGATVKIIDNSKDFIDTRNHWSRDEVNFVAARELFNGVGNNLFGVSGDMTRGMVNTVLARLAGEDTNGGANWYDKGTEWAKKNGITDGTNPTANVTREQLAAMLYRFAGSPKVSGELSFADADQISGYAKDALLWAVQNGILNGIGNNLAAPTAGAERAQVAAMMARYLKNVG